MEPFRDRRGGSGGRWGAAGSRPRNRLAFGEFCGIVYMSKGRGAAGVESATGGPTPFLLVRGGPGRLLRAASSRRSVEAFYVPAADWDEKTPFVVAVTVLSDRRQYNLRAYVILGDWGVAHFSPNENLQWLLKIDNTLRRSGGEKRLWVEPNCRMWPGGDP